MNDYENGIITGSIGLGVDYYKGEKGDKPVKGVDYFTKEDIDEIAAYIEGDGIDLSDYAKKEDVEAAIEGITFPAETDPVFTASAAASITPTDISSWNSKSDFSGDYEDLTNKPTIPTKTSELTNDSDFVAQSELSDYATKDYVEGVIAGVETGMLKRSIVSTLPSSGIDENTIYMVERSESESGNVYDEYMYVGSSWEKIGSTDVDLTDYWKKTDLTFTNGLTESNGTVSWNLFGRIRSGNGERSILEGTATNAGVDAHAEGEYTKANGAASHAEGESTTASGYASHAEGKNTTASGYASHTEGVQAVASGADSHAEGLGAHAIGDYSHAEGQGSYAMGECSHAEGQYISATGHYSHAEGKFNVADSNNIFQNIAGNGTADNARSNSFARDWNGNEYLAGDLFVNCSDYTTDANGLTTENAGGSKVATEDYVDQAIADIPTGGGGESYTAGNGVEIDANNKITSQSVVQHDYLLNFDGHSFSGVSSMSYESDATKFVEELRKGTKLFGKVKFTDTSLRDALRAIHTNTSVYRITDNGSYNYYVSTQYQAFLNITGGTYYYILQEWPDSFSIFIATSVFGMRCFLGRLLGYVNSSGSATYIADAIDALNTRVPTVPTTDGDYKLTTSISSGTATTEWVEDSSSGGATYTAGNGIEIDNDTIRTIPFPVFQALFSWNNFYYTDTNNTALITSSTDEGNNAIQELLKGKMILISSAAFSNYTITPAKLGKTTAQLAYIDFDVQGTYITSISKAASVNWKNNAYHYYDGNILYIWTKATNKPLPNLLPVKIGTRSVEGLGAALQRHENKIGLPTLPSGTDGDYKLTATVADGSTTTQWVEDSGSSGGSSYTAGAGIDIDSNNVISAPGVKTYPMFTSGLNGNVVSNDTPLSVLNETTLLNGLKNKQTMICEASQGISIAYSKLYDCGFFGIYVIKTDYQYDGVFPSPSILSLSDSSTGNYKFEYGYVVMPIDNKLFVYTQGMSSARTYYMADLVQSLVWKNNYVNLSGFRLSSYLDSIDNALTNINTRIPTAPTADGSYKLTSTTTSGSSTYSWVVDSSTSYTAGNGISIDSNGVISLDLSSAEGVGF